VLDAGGVAYSAGDLGRWYGAGDFNVRPGDRFIPLVPGSSVLHTRFWAFNPEGWVFGWHVEATRECWLPPSVLRSDFMEVLCDGYAAGRKDGNRRAKADVLDLDGELLTFDRSPDTSLGSQKAALWQQGYLGGSKDGDRWYRAFANGDEANANSVAPYRFDRPGIFKDSAVARPSTQLRSHQLPGHSHEGAQPESHSFMAQWVWQWPSPA
jgi:hypothetical protein